MSLLDGFLENTEIFKGEENRLDQAAFENLLAAEGSDVGRGYLKGVYEVTEILNRIVMIRDGNAAGLPETAANAYSKLSNLHKALYEFVCKNDLSLDHLNEPFPHRTKTQKF